MIEEADSYVFYKSFYDGMKNMSIEDVAAANHALHAYALYGIEPDTGALSPIVQTLFVMAKPQIDANKKRRQDGNKGGRPKNKTGGFGNENHRFYSGKPNVNENVNVNANANANYMPDSDESGDLPSGIRARLN